MSKGEREGAKDKLCLLHYFAKNLALADKPGKKNKNKKHAWSQYKFHRKTACKYTVW